MNLALPERHGLFGLGIRNCLAERILQSPRGMVADYREQHPKCRCWLVEITEKRKDRNKMETITIQFSNAMLYDRIHTLSAEYNVSADLLIGLAVKRLIDDVEVVRNLRNGEIKLE